MSVLDEVVHEEFGVRSKVTRFTKAAGVIVKSNGDSNHVCDSDATRYRYITAVCLILQTSTNEIKEMYGTNRGSLRYSY